MEEMMMLTTMAKTKGQNLIVMQREQRISEKMRQIKVIRRVQLRYLLIVCIQ
jgi:hypothetical protein